MARNRFVYALLLALVPASAGAFSAEHSGFSLRVRRDVNPYAVFGLFVLPGESVPLSVIRQEGVQGPFELSLSAPADGTVKAQGPSEWLWTAPREEGLHRLRVVERPTGRTMILNAFVMIPAQPGAVAIRGYSLGRYPATPLRGLAAYQPPRGFVEVTAANRDVLVSPHFTLGQFVCKEGSGWPKPVALREPLMLKLEALLEAANSHGWQAETFHVMSGFRTPVYNRGLNNVSYSRHQYGDAADVFIDNDGNGVMDDLNHDGKVDKADAMVLHDLFAQIEKTPQVAPYVGGIGVYSATSAHGPYVHVDARGFTARWGE